MPRGIPHKGFRRTRRWMERMRIEFLLEELRSQIKQGALKDFNLDRDETDEIMDFMQEHAERFETLDPALLIDLATVYQISPERFAQTARTAFFKREEENA